MKIFRCLLLLALPLGLNAQQKTNALPAQVIELATWIPTSTPIKGQRYLLPAEAHSYYHGSAKKELILILKKDKEVNIGPIAELLVLDINKGEVKWSMNLNSFDVFVTDKYILTSNGSNLHCYHRINGKQNWRKMDARLKYIDEEKGILLTDYIRALNINSGKIIWQKYLPVKYNWEDVEPVDDSSVVLVSGGVYKINLYNGQGWSSNELTSGSEFEIPTALGLLPETERFPAVKVSSINNEPATWRTVSSGALAEEQRVYVASNSHVYALDLSNGKLLWSASLPPEQTGMSTLYSTTDQIVLVNEGKVGNRTGQIKKHGKAYIFAFDKETGTQQYIKELNTDPILDSEIPNDKILLVTKNATLLYDLKTGAELSKQATAAAQHIIHDAYSGTGTESYEGRCCYVYLGGRDVLYLNPEDRTSYELGIKDLAMNEPQGNMQVLYNGRHSVTRDGEVLIRVPESNKGFTHGDKLYIVEGNTLSVVPLKEPK